ncbi:Ger(x)C family spore germination protein [Clostridium sp. JS66]|uniref:Ger(x)C family spore germination protein n=1 Tax=Clostridium sp. JS66 TaxID=3064705 RepID=UPI00298E26D5|nr:Ger(x)C family spore germination protein [Clostridium sp. JS66]WPC44247.1 Ger(x)C family spore germination protein [Clostridium sp. JS66]
MNRKNLTILLLVVMIGSIYTEKLQVTPMEEFNISSGFGLDIKKETDSKVQYVAPFSVYQFKEQKGESSKNITGKAESLTETRQDRQLKSNKPLLIGVQRIVIIGEEAADYGILSFVNLNFANPQINDRSNIVVCKGKSEDLLAHTVEGYPSSSDYIEGMIKSANNYNFFPKEYTFLNIYSILESEGRNLVLPYIELKDKDIVLSGMAVFKKDKMAYTLPMEESKIMNMLRLRSGKGVLSLQQSPEEYINYYTKVKRKVRCNKKQDIYQFNIDLIFQGDIVLNTLYKDIDIDKKKEKEIEELLSQEIEKMCNGFLNKMKEVYKMDLLELGMYSVAKYGRESGVNWNKEISDANIKVNVKVKIDKIGIGHY